MLKVLQVILIVGFVVFSSETTFAEIVNLEDAINKAGRQRMLTQRMLKSYSMIGLDVKADEAKKHLDTAIAEFDAQLAELIRYSPNAQIKQKLQHVASLWRSVRVMMTEPVKQSSAETLLQKNDALLRVMNQAVKQLEQLSTSPHGRLVNIAGRQRMLSQRLAKFYMLRAWGINNAMIRDEEAIAEAAFRKAMGELMAAKENTAAINKVLKKAKMEWDLMKYGLDKEGENYVPLIVAMTSEKLLKTMEQATTMYSELSR